MFAELVAVVLCFFLGPTVDIKVLQEKGGRVDWAADGERIAFDRLEDDGRYGVYTMRPDGSDIQPVTRKFSQFKNRDAGQPAWHPTSYYLVFQVEKEKHPPVRARYLTSPDAGHYNDLWLFDVRAGKVQRLYETPGKDCGLLHPHFSIDGKKFSWSEMYERPNSLKKGKELGLWKLKVADFRVGPDGPVLANIRDLEPVGQAFYENHGFSPDGKKVLFTSNGKRTGESALKGEDIFTVELSSGTIKLLTATGYNEYASFSPNGSRVVWMTNFGNGLPGRTVEQSGTDYWIMNPDGSDKQRLTRFNQLGHPHSAGQIVIAADFSWRPDGKAFIAYYHSGLTGTESDAIERMVLVMLKE